jgi:hypothetical protein
MIPNFKEILSELSYRVEGGIPDLTKESHVNHLIDILRENGISDAAHLAQRARVYFSYLNEAESKRIAPPKGKTWVKNRESGAIYAVGTVDNTVHDIPTDDEISTAKKSGALSKDEPQQQGPNAFGVSGGGASVFPGNDDNSKKSEVDVSDTPKYVQAGLDSGNLDNLKKVNQELLDSRDLGVAGAGGPVASYGEARLCSFANQLAEMGGYGKYVDNNKDAIFEEKKKLISDPNFIKNKDKVVGAVAKELGAELPKDEQQVLDYLAARNHFANEELARLKANKNSLWYKTGKQGFGENEAAFREWAKADFDGALSTGVLVRHGSKIDTSKPYVMIQSNPKKGGHDEGVYNHLKGKLGEAKRLGKQDDVEHYEREVRAFEKLGFHDTMVVGQDKNGRTTVLSITNKKQNDLADIWGNTTPEFMLNVIKNKFPPDVSKKVIQTIDDGILKVSDSKKATVRVFSKMKLDDGFAAVCSTPEMGKYMDALKVHKKFNAWMQENGVKAKNNMQLLQAAQQYTKQAGDAAYEPFGKILSKVGELTQIGKFRNKYPKIDFSSSAIAGSIKNKNDEKDLTAAVHANVVESVGAEDKKLGYPNKNNENGPHTQAYIATVMHSMHFDLMVENFDGNLGAITGIRGSVPSDFRGCLEKLSGYKRNPKHDEKQHRASLNNHLLTKCKLDPQSRAIIVTNESGTYNLAEDTWRTAGTTQKVEKKLGTSLRGCIASSVDARRKSEK